MGSWWRGRRLAWDPDRQTVEQERQRWVMESLTDVNIMIQQLTVDPETAYHVHRNAYVDTGDPFQLMMMLEYVRG